MQTRGLDSVTSLLRMDFFFSKRKMKCVEKNKKNKQLNFQLFPFKSISLEFLSKNSQEKKIMSCHKNQFGKLLFKKNAIKFPGNNNK